MKCILALAPATLFFVNGQAFAQDAEATLTITVSHEGGFYAGHSWGQDGLAPDATAVSLTAAF